MKKPRLKKLRIAKYTTNISAFAALAISGSIWALSKNDWQLFMIKPERPEILGAILAPIIIALFGIIAIFKDQITSYFKFPKRVKGAISILLISILVLLLGNIAIWIIITSGLYLALTTVNTLYFNPAIEKELKKLEQLEQKETKEVAE